MNQIPLRYNISDWHQLSHCLSNTSVDLSIRVADLIQNSLITGLRITVEHNTIGILFSYVINPSGDIVLDDDVPGYVLTTEQILAILKKFGFFVTYDRRSNLSQEQITFLTSVNDLGYQKLRWIYTPLGTKYLVVFNVAQHPAWIDNTYMASEHEVQNGLLHSSIVNLTENSVGKNYDWSWLDYVANIDDILADQE